MRKREEKYLNETLNISFNWFICKESRKLKWRDLTGPEKLQLFRNIKIDKVLPTFEDAGKIELLWKNFLVIAELLSSSNQHEIATNKYLYFICF